jgi:CRISPR system Cascade subunit CasD
MTPYLLFRLYGPLAAWGTIAVGQERPSDAHPGKSAILGLLAAAMGVRREEENLHALMAAAYGFAVRVDAPGLLLRDYHTAQVPPERRKVVHYTRRDELRSRSKDLNTILSSREYRCDALYTVALWIGKNQSPPFTLEELVQGIRQPRFVLYLGRKSCPLALPVQAAVVTAAHLEAAFAQVDFKDDEDFDRGLKRDGALLCWELGADVGGWQPLYTVTRHDHPLSRRRWQFSERSEHQKKE